MPGWDLLTEPAELIPNSFDGTATYGLRPTAVVFPRSSQQIAELLTFAAAKELPVVTRGSGTGLSGAACRATAVWLFVSVKRTGSWNWTAPTSRFE